VKSLCLLRSEDAPCYEDVGSSGGIDPRVCNLASTLGGGG
jgi:hypothetical protein